MQVEDFDYELPPELIAQEPPKERGSSRMLVLHRSRLKWEDRLFVDLPHYLGPGDCLILNNSRVLPSRLFGTRPASEARLQVFLVESLSPDQLTWKALVRPGRKVRKGDRIRFSEILQAEVIGWGEHGERTVRFDAGVNVLAEVERIGHVPLPPYIHREDRPYDRERYQTVYSRSSGSVAAPTAGLHFTPAMLERCRLAGVGVAEVTLHVGLGTFASLHHEQVEANKLHSERYSIAPAEWERIQSASRCVAVGTTSVRTLESAGESGALSGRTEIFLYPGYSFRIVNAMLTNFHLPKSSLLILVAAFAGRDFVLDAYRHAVQQQYRFFSYGDCMLIL